MNLSIFSPIPHTPRHSRTSANAYITAADIIYSLVTTLTYVNTISVISAMSGIYVDISVVPCTDITAIAVITDVVIVTVVNGTVTISIFI